MKEEQIENILKNVEPIKISIIMQSYLGDYPGSRSESISKFRRAVKSFQNQLYKNCELIIVSDGCTKTQQIYNREFKEDSAIQLIYVDKKENVLNTYEKTEDENTYYRGFPRRVGVGAATGSLITYMDSDDYLLPEFTATLMLTYNSEPKKDWWINTSWYDNYIVDWPETDIMNATKREDGIDIPGLSSLWVKVDLKPGSAVLSPWLFMHRVECTTKWRDTIGGSEDSDFNRRLRAQYPAGAAFASPIYARCHFKEQWDV